MTGVWGRRNAYERGDVADICEFGVSGLGGMRRLEVFDARDEGREMGLRGVR